MSKCEVCCEHLSKYKCPGCLLRTCSLPCVKRHKVESSCNGQRDKTAYVRMNDFTDMNLLSDYRMLEEMQRRTDNTHRDQLKRRNNKPNFLLTLVKEAKKRGICLKTMPYPMDKRKNNFTAFQHKTRTIFWQVEWIFPQSDVKYVGKRISEHSTMCELLNEYIHPTDSDPVKRQALKQYCKEGVESCRLFLKVEDRPANDKRYHELELKKTLQENLVGRCVVEYPTIHVVLNQHCSGYQLLNTESSESIVTSMDCVDESDSTNTEVTQNKLHSDKDYVTKTSSTEDLHNLSNNPGHVDLSPDFSSGVK